MLLEPAQQRRQAGPAADGDDPRAAREEPLLVDELDERLVRIAAPGAGRSGRGRPGTTPNSDERDADRAGDEPAQRERQELERQEVDERADEPGRVEVAGDLAQEMGEREGQQEQPGEDDERASA